MSWFLSWLPGLPSIDFALPSSIQRRFISFALKKSLGRILRPGQLEVHQLDSQIESGYVQLKDLELDSEAITSMLIGIPIKLHDGSISAVTARIPSPNPLNSTVGLTIHSLHLTFHLTPSISEPIDLSATTFAAPVASAAMSFIHDELTSPEETTLRESFHPGLASSFHDHIHNMPGSMDPFPHDVDEDGSHLEVDPTGMVIFATLIKRLCASSELDAFDTKITITHPAHASFTFSVAEICYRIQGAVGGASENNIGREEQASGASRKVSISGLTVSARDLRPPFPFRILLTPSPASPISPTRSSRFPASPLSPHRSHSTSATSSPTLDEDAVLNISQSLANLQLQLAPDAPEPPSSKMSDINVVPSSEEHSSPDTNHDGFSFGREGKDTAREHDFEPEDEVILSHCAEPILIGLGKPPASPGFSENSFAHPQSAPAQHQSPQERNKFAGAKNVKYTFSAGVLAFAFRAWHIRSALDMLDAWDSHHVRAVLDPPADQAPVPSFADTLCTLGIDAFMKIHGVVILLLPSRNLVEPCSLDSFFADPLVPPRLPHGCVRIFLDGLLTSCSLSKSTPPISHTHPRATARAATAAINAVTTDFALDDLSAFALLATQTSAIHDRELSASPIVIADRNIPTQYPTAHIHPGIKVKENHDYPLLSKFPILDWTAKTHQTNSAEISKWRTKIQEKPSESQEKMGVGVSPFPTDSAQNVGSVDETEATHTPAIDLHARFTWTSAEEGLISGKGLHDHVELDVVPLHVFGDLGLVLGDNALVFVNEAASRYTDAEEDSPTNNESGERDGDMANAATQRHRTETGIEKERLDCLASETERLDLDGKRIRSTSASRGQQADKSRRTSFWQRLEIVVNLSMIRFQFRCPPPPPQTPRSGAVILDLHDTNVSIKATSDKRPAADARSPTPSLASHAHNLSSQDAPFIAECRRVVIATSLPGQEMANIVLSLGSLCSEDFIPCDATTSSSASTLSARLLPLQVIINRSASPTRSPSSTPSVVGTISVTIDSPSAHVDLPKSLLEGLQLWAADVSQLAEQKFGTIVWDTDTRGESRFTSLMRSIFFAKSRRYGRNNDQGGVSGAHPKARVETVISSALSEVFVRLERPRDNEVSPPVRCFDTFASDVDILIEMKPDGKDETLITLGVIDLNVYDTSIVGPPEPFVSFTAHRSFSTTPKSIVQLQFIPQTAAESDA